MDKENEIILNYDVNSPLIENMKKFPGDNIL